MGINSKSKICTLLLIGIFVVPFVIAKPLDEPELCNGIFYFIKGNNWNYDFDDVEILRIELNMDINHNLLDFYIEEHKALCSDLGYSEELPEKQTNTINNINTPKEKIIECDTVTGIEVFDWRIPLPKISIGNNIPCNRINKLKWWMPLEREGDNYFLRGIKLWTILLLMVGLFVFLFIKVNYGLNETNESETLLN